jgi:NRPS condensation-like uncharacterized protein
MTAGNKRIPTTYTDRAIGFIDCLIEPMIQLEIRFAESLDAERLRKAIDLTLDAEPVLGCRLVSHWRRPYFERLEQSAAGAFLYTEDEAAYEAFKRASIDVSQGPQIRVYLWHSTSGDRLLLKVSHLCSDVSGVKEAVGLISDIYSRLGQDLGYKPETNASGSRSLWQVMRHVPWHAYPRIYLNYLQGLRSQMPKEGSHTLPYGEGPSTQTVFVHRLIPEDRVARLIDYGRAFDATLNDLVIAAILRALVVEADWNRASYLRLATSVDLRQWYPPNERAEAIANLSSLEYTNLGRDLGDDFPATLERVATDTKRRKANWIGLSDLMGGLPSVLLPDVWAKSLYQRTLRRVIKKGNLPPGLTNMGPISPQSVTLDTPALQAWLLPPPCLPPYFLTGLSGYRGTLSLSAGVRLHQKDLAERFFDRVLSELPA